MAFTGRLEGLTVFDILQYLGILKKSGKLTLTRLGSSGVFVFRNGEVVSAACDSVQNALGNILIKDEHLTEDALRIALELQHLSPNGSGSARFWSSRDSSPRACSTRRSGTRSNRCSSN